MNGNLPGAKQIGFKGSFLLLLLLLGGALAVVCHEGFRPYEVFWANDLPLGALVESSARLPSSFFGSWSDFYFLGGPNVAFPPNLSNMCRAILTPEVQLKFYVPLSMFFLGFSAWFFFRQLRFGALACVIGGLGAGLNMHFFSNGCWGLCQWILCCAMIFMALGILASPAIGKLWIKGVLAGLCTGMAVMEGFDVGAILSIYVAVFAVFWFLTTEPDKAKGAAKTLYVGAVLVVSALLISLSTISTLVATQMTGTGTVGQSETEQREAWDRNTQFSIPKVETLRMIIPGLFGYRLDVYTTSTNPSTYYWGRVAEDPHVEELESSDPVVRSNAAASLPLPIPDPIRAILARNTNAMPEELKASPQQINPVREDLLDKVKGYLQRRHTGNGEYVGVLVCLLALFGLFNAARKGSSPFLPGERRAVWFWGAAALFSLLAAWGRYSFVYAFIYRIPLIASFRNPQKYMHPLNICLMILSGYGLEALSRQYLAGTANGTASFAAMISTWWKRVSAFEKRWGAGCALALVGSVVGWFILASSKPDLESHLLHNGFNAAAAPQIARFCVGEVGWFIFYFALSAGVLACILGGVFSGRRAVWAWVLLAGLMICDLSRSDVPWIRFYNYKQKISLNPVTALLRQKPWEYRVNSRSWPAGGYLSPELTGLCHWWLENDYPFNDIESLEIDQDPRMSVMNSAYLGDFAFSSDTDLWRATRLWQLTNTRYILAGADWEPRLNQFGKPENSFRTVMRMNVVPKPGIVQPEDPGDTTVQIDSQGSVALFEFTRALPRAKLYSNWKTVDDPTALRLLGSLQFDPEKTVLVAKETPVVQTPTNPDADPGTVQISHYQSKHLILEAEAKTPAVLLLNDHTGDSWYVWIDRKPGAVLRCNDVMQGVFVPPGHHTIEFRYEPPLKLLFISLAAFGFGVILTGIVVFGHFRRGPDTTPATPAKPGKA